MGIRSATLLSIVGITLGIIIGSNRGNRMGNIEFVAWAEKTGNTDFTTLVNGPGALQMVKEGDQIFQEFGDIIKAHLAPVK